MHGSTAASNRGRIDADEILEGIVDWVRIESPSDDPVAVNRMADKVEADFRAVGARIERTAGRDGRGDILVARSAWGDHAREKGILVLSHIDTVHPVGMIRRLKIERRGDSVFGPGIYDMKGGAYVAYYAYRHLVREGLETTLPVTFMFVPDEEVGSETARQAIEAEAAKAKFVLVMEPGRDGGKVVTARKGVGRFVVSITGRPSHAGVRHEDGRSAIKEAARQILDIEGFTDYARGVTCNVGLIAGGSGVNVVPEVCRLEVDLRVPDKALGEEMTARLLSLKSHDADVRVEVAGGMNRPPYGKDAGIAKLFELAKQIAARDGYELKDVPLTGGGSDGNFTAALGVPTLDGLGPDGKGAHTDYEQIYYSSLVSRTRLMLGLLQELN